MSKVCYIKNDRFNAYDLFFYAGWTYEGKSWAPELSLFSLTIDNETEIRINASVSVDREGMKIGGNIGIEWIEITLPAFKTKGMTHEWLEKCIVCLERIEKNLVRLRIPFVGNYKFHGKNKDKLKTKNDRLRKKTGINELEYVLNRSWNKEVE